MIGRIETTLRRWRRRFSRSEWMARLLGLPTSKSPSSAPGLILIQIDGLAHPQLEKALAKGRMPFLKRLMDREHYHLEHLYPGIPTTTPAVQAELFYGVRQAVPAFGFMMRDSQQLVRMYDPDVAARVEEKITARYRNPLLRGGSCYLSLFRAGAEHGEAHFCPADRGWGPALREAGPLKMLLMLITNAWSLVRTGALVVVEGALAMTDCVRGVIQGQDLIRELMFVPTRVAVTILMRELCTIGVKIDIARGLPVIYVNLLGYDEQSHRRGPHSGFAHWTLKGIDDAIARIWRAAHRSDRRNYDVWIFSDHGQEQAQPYEERHGRTLGDALTEALADLPTEPRGYHSNGRRGMQLERARLFGSEWIQKMIPEDSPQYRGDEPRLALAALGPVAMLYNLELNSTPREQVARLIVEKAGVPLVLYRTAPSDPASPVHGWWYKGPVRLPEDGPQLLGSGHPFPKETIEDVAQLCRHTDAGEFMMFGWCAGREPMTFAMENGSHGGIGPNETHAFALMPADIPSPDPERGYWRPEELRSAARLFLRGARPAPAAPRAAPVKTLRVMTYNVHSCRGVDGKLSPQRIARIIARYHPDVVALQELDVKRQRSGGLDQAERIARLLAMDYHFHPALHMEEERYGDAILSRLPMRLVKKDILPGPPDDKSSRFSPARFNPAAQEPRGAVWVEVDYNGKHVQILNTHLGLSKAERLRQVEALLGPEWLAHPNCRGPRLLLGDFNALPNSIECKRLGSRLHDAQIKAPEHIPLGTFFSRMPKVRIDHIFVEPGLEVSRILVPRTELTRQASDHLPLIADLVVGGED
ncbi:endonuclease/exonuclease/phosphatase family protein [Microbulbifer rhizosphaerae]|uniref:Endonuclease/exonuclease/phosphatase family metal-dependent hydrolase n=1 Tax=Microbulbifer rhizosphaerae TaxID=1562603 RepID=A0A7W4Z985_9GAMM|nr:endonuclease/exonuclease/phosphatase family protein [Microbulbifer rhizosphaerae]MBB3059965.1 endonuclease/exonuclease/phosphatase family metal-dependent hydrolase [Microbulbifer rhizosphaerae]